MSNPSINSGRVCLEVSPAQRSIHSPTESLLESWLEWEGCPFTIPQACHVKPPEDPPSKTFLPQIPIARNPSPHSTLNIYIHIRYIHIIYHIIYLKSWDIHSETKEVRSVRLAHCLTVALALLANHGIGREEVQEALRAAQLLARITCFLNLSRETKEK